VDAVKGRIAAGSMLHHARRRRHRRSRGQSIVTAPARPGARNVPVIADGGIRYSGDIVEGARRRRQLPR